MKWTEDKLEKFIKNNKEKFNVVPRPGLENSIFAKLKSAIKSIVPYLIKVSIFVVIIWGISFSLYFFFDLPTIWGLFWMWIT